MLGDSSAERADGKKGNAWVYAICLSGSLALALFMIVNGLLLKVFPVFSLLVI